MSTLEETMTNQISNDKHLLFRDILVGFPETVLNDFKLLYKLEAYIFQDRRYRMDEDLDTSYLKWNLQPLATKEELEDLIIHLEGLKYTVDAFELNTLKELNQSLKRDCKKLKNKIKYQSIAQQRSAEEMEFRQR